MAPNAEKLLREALALPEDARVDLAAALLQSVEREPATDGADAAWSAEAKRRLEEVGSGAVKPVPWDEAERQIFDL
jgi:putative addiction module component (TIGR02574 family)